jgi:hypothetical protein
MYRDSPFNGHFFRFTGISKEIITEFIKHIFVFIKPFFHSSSRITYSSDLNAAKNFTLEELVLLKIYCIDHSWHSTEFLVMKTLI